MVCFTRMRHTHRKVEEGDRVVKGGVRVGSWELEDSGKVSWEGWP